VHSAHAGEGGPTREFWRPFKGMSKLWMAADAMTVVMASILVDFYDAHRVPLVGARGLWREAPIHGHSPWVQLALLCGYAAVMIATSGRLHLYSHTRLGSILHEQRLSAQVCLTSGLLLTGAIYLARLKDIPRHMVLLTIGLVTVAQGVRRLMIRVLVLRRFRRGIGTRKVLIVGTGPEAYALRHLLQSQRYLGYTFEGFVACGNQPDAAAGDVVGTLENLFQSARKFFVDEIFITARCDRDTVQEVFEKARVAGLGLRVVPNLYGGLAWGSPVEYIGHLPTIPLHCGKIPELGLIVKRAFDIAFSATVLVLLLPLYAFLAVAIKLDSPGPVFYLSERIGKKGRIFRCTKFRTMEMDAEKRKADLMHMNERDGVLFKVSNDPRVTRLGRFMRKYSLDELPQFWNVLRGEMSVVGPRPPLACEVRKYKLSHLRRLDVTPGITGLWQVEARQDPSFASYVSLDIKYIDNWSIWLDFTIVLRTLGVVFAGTGS
jgi:exopolysaccharide biosynthesis polyprenyl glycosylphosphotransferase